MKSKKLNKKSNPSNPMNPRARVIFYKKNRISTAKKHKTK